MTDESHPQPEQNKRSLRWEVPREEIESMDEVQRTEYLAELSEMTGRLRNVVRAIAGDEEGVLTLRDVDLMLDPEEHSDDQLSSA